MTGTGTYREALVERFLARGFAEDALNAVELVGLLLTGSGTQRGKTHPLARRLLDAFHGDFAELISAEPDALRRAGASDKAIAQLKAVHVAAQYLTRTRLNGQPVIGSWSQLIDYLTVQIARDATEQFRVLFLDRKNVLIADETHGQGTVDHCPVYVREIAKRALLLNASAIIIAHNHPSGDPTPSQADIAMTNEIHKAAATIGVTLHDHVVIGRAGHASFRSLGLL
jgi:DNA repair protein RadC